MRYTGLKTRVRRLEKRHRGRKPLPTIISAIHPAEGAGEPIGLEGAGVVVMRADLEAVDVFQRRAAALIPARFLKTLYAPSPAEIEPVSAAAPPPEAVPVDPWALAGIGRQATRQELIQMGALPVPAERLI